jgi:hypothetical protein
MESLLNVEKSGKEEINSILIISTDYFENALEEFINLTIDKNFLMNKEETKEKQRPKLDNRRKRMLVIPVYIYI